MTRISAEEKIIIFSRYIGRQVVVNSYLNNEQDLTGTLLGVRHNALLVDMEGFTRWIPFNDDINLCDIKLLLKPLKQLTPKIIDTANNLPPNSP